MAEGKYIDTDILVLRMTETQFLACYDEKRTGKVEEVDDEIVQLDIDSAEGEVDSYLVLLHDLPVEMPAGVQPKIDRLVKLAALDYCQALAWLHHPEYPRTFGENGKARGLWAIAEKRMERLRKDLQQLPDLVAKASLVPKNTGGFVQTNEPGEDEETNGRHFDDTGIF